MRSTNNKYKHKTKAKSSWGLNLKHKHRIFRTQRKNKVSSKKCFLFIGQKRGSRNDPTPFLNQRRKAREEEDTDRVLQLFQKTENEG